MNLNLPTLCLQISHFVPTPYLRQSTVMVHLHLGCHDVAAGEEEGEGEGVVVLHLQHLLLTPPVHQPTTTSDVIY